MIHTANNIFSCNSPMEMKAKNKSFGIYIDHMHFIQSNP